MFICQISTAQWISSLGFTQPVTMRKEIRLVKLGSYSSSELHQTYEEETVINKNRCEYKYSVRGFH